MNNLTRVQKLRNGNRSFVISGKPLVGSSNNNAVVETEVDYFWSGWSSAPSYNSVPSNGSGVTWTLTTSAIDLFPRSALISFYSNNSLFIGGSVNASNCTSLTSLQLNSASVTNLNLTNCSSLHRLQFQSNSLSAINFSGCESLNYCVLLNNKLSSVDLSGLSKLGYLDIMSNSLTSLDLTETTSLSGLICSNNEIKGNLTGLSSLSATNGSKNIMIMNNKMTAEHLNGVYGQLPNKGSATGSWTINVRDNPGTSSHDTTIATDKGWIVKEE